MIHLILFKLIRILKNLSIYRTFQSLKSGKSVYCVFIYENLNFKFTKASPFLFGLAFCFTCNYYYLYNYNILAV